MPYHQVDERWPVFGCKDYETYLDRYLVKGNFHIGVPEDVKESFQIVEYLIAHAWYHYPVYDEAFNRVLRTYELAVKKKCTLLSIPIQRKNKKGETINRDLVDLIKDVCNREPNKRQKLFLDFLRDLRNILMHPNEHSYAGGAMFNKIVFAVNIINILFAPESFMVSLDELRTERQKEVSLLNGKPMTALSDNKGILIHSIHLVDVFKTETDEIILFHAEPVCRFTDEQKTKLAYPPQIPYEILNPIITNERITGIDLNTSHNITIILATDERDLNAAKNFQTYLHDLKTPPTNYNPYLTHTMHEMGEGLQKFRYKHYQSINISVPSGH